MSPSEAHVINSVDITSASFVVFGSRPSATTLRTMSRSVMIPSSLPLPPTIGIGPTSSLFINCAACSTKSVGAHVFGFFVITSLSVILYAPFAHHDCVIYVWPLRSLLLVSRTLLRTSAFGYGSWIELFPETVRCEGSLCNPSADRLNC